MSGELFRHAHIKCRRKIEIAFVIMFSCKFVDFLKDDPFIGDDLESLISP